MRPLPPVAWPAGVNGPRRPRDVCGIPSPPPSPLPRAGFFGDLAVRAVAKQSQLVQSPGPSAEDAAGSTGAVGAGAAGSGLQATQHPQQAVCQDTGSARWGGTCPSVPALLPARITWGGRTRKRTTGPQPRGSKHLQGRVHGRQLCPRRGRTSMITVDRPLSASGRSGALCVPCSQGECLLPEDAPASTPLPAQPGQAPTGGSDLPQPQCTPEVHSPPNPTLIPSPLSLNCTGSGS